LANQPWIPPRQQADRDAQIASIRRKLDDVTKAIELVDIVAEEAKRPLWTQILRPFLEKEVLGFREASLSMTKEDFEKAQARAALARDLLQDIDGKADPTLRPRLVAQATALNETLEKHSSE